MTTAIISHPACLEHEMGEGHPESPQRLWAIQDALIQSRVLELLREYDGIEASREQICRVHTPQLYDSIAELVPTEHYAAIDGDTLLNRHSFKAALCAAGSVVLASQLVLQQEVNNAFCAVRPPGHHAESARSMGFCVFNNIAVGVAHVLATTDIKRVAIVDFDVHQGNGTEDIFKDDPRVLFCSSFQHPFYPNTYLDSQPGHIVNTPLAAGTGSEAFRQSISEHWMPELESFQPEMVFISAGFDAHQADDMALFNLTVNDFAWVTERIMDIANRFAQGRIVSSLEGGYNLPALGACVVAHIKALMNIGHL